MGKFITASNDYFYPLAAPLIYGLLLVLVLLFVVVRRRSDAAPAVVRPGAGRAGRRRTPPRRRYRRLLVAGLVLVGVGWVVTLLVFAAIDPATIREAIDRVVNLPGERVKRPEDPLFYGLEAAILGGSGVLLLVAGGALGLGRERAAIRLATVGLVIALTAGAILSLYVEQISAITSTLFHAGLLFGVVHYRNRFLAGSDEAGDGPLETSAG